MTVKPTHEAEEPSPGCYLTVKGLLDSFKSMPRFLSPFRRRDHEPEYIDPQPIYSDNHRYRPGTPSGSSQRNISSPKYLQQRDVVYVNDHGEEYMMPPSNVESYPGALLSRGRNRADGYSDTSFTDSDVRYARHRSRTPQTHVSEPIPYIERLTPQESFDMAPQTRLYSRHAPPERPATPVYNIPTAPPNPEFIPPRIQEMPVVREQPRRIYAKPGESITVNGVQIEVQGSERRRRYGGHGNYDTRARSKSRSRDDYASDGYSTSSSYEEQPIIIRADPRAEIQIGNDRDGYIPYHQYASEQRRYHKSRSHHHRRAQTLDEEVYVVPAGANVIFVDEDGRELHRVGDFDERRYPRRGNPRVRPKRQVDGSYVIDL